MKFSAPIISTAILLSSTVSAQSPSVTTTLTVHPGCPSATATADVMVTRSAVAVPSCAAGGNETKASIISMSGSGGMVGSPTSSGNAAEFTGAAAGNTAMGVVVVGLFGGLVAALMV